MIRKESSNHSLLVREKYEEFSDDVVVLHSGTRIDEGKMLQLISGEKGASGKHNGVFLDFGARIGGMQQGFSTLHPEVQNGTFNFILYNTIPQSVQEVLRQDLPNKATVRRVGERLRHSSGGTKAEEDYKRKNAFQKQEVTTGGVVLSHAHPDHDGLIAFLDESIPVITSPQTYLLEQLEQKHKPNGLINNIVSFTAYPTEPEKREKKERDFVALTDGELYNINDQRGFFVSLLPTTHWFGSHAAEVYFPSGNRVMSTSDVRSGEHTNLLEEYLAMTHETDLMVVDATHVGKQTGNYLTERELSHEFTKRFITAGPHYVAVHAEDFGRLTTVAKAAKEVDKEVYIPLDMAYFLLQIHTAFGPDHPDIPDLGNIKVHLQPVKTGKYLPSDYRTHLASVLSDDRIEKVPQEELHHTRHITKRAVILFSHPKQMDLFGSRSLFARGKKLIFSTFNDNQYDPDNTNKWSRVNKILNINNMTRETLNAIHHLNTDEFIHFIEHHAKTKNMLVLPNRDPEFVTHIIEARSKSPVRVLHSMLPGEPYYLDGTPVKRKSVSYG